MRGRSESRPGHTTSGAVVLDDLRVARSDYGWPAVTSGARLPKP